MLYFVLSTEVITLKKTPGVSALMEFGRNRYKQHQNTSIRKMALDSDRVKGGRLYFREGSQGRPERGVSVLREMKGVTFLVVILTLRLSRVYMEWYLEWLVYCGRPH